MRRLTIARGIASAIASLIALTGAMAADIESSAPPKQGVEIAVLNASLDDPGWPVDFDKVLPRLSDARTAGARITFTESDIDEWNWNVQAITLSRTATQRLLASLPAESELADSVRQMKRGHERLNWGNQIGLSLHTRGFLVTLQGEPVFGGVFLEAVSERRVNIPVIRTTLVDGRVVLHVLPVHLPFLMVDPGSPDHDVTIDQVAPEARRDWQMAKIMLRRAYGTEAVRIRAIVRNSRLHETLQRTGKLSTQ